MVTGVAEFSLRLGRVEDAAAAAEVDFEGAQAFAETPYAAIAAAAPAPAEGFERFARAGAEGRLLVAEAVGVIGIAIVAVDGADAHLEGLDVRAAWRRRGVGAALLCAAEVHARAHGAERLMLTTFRRIAFNAPFYDRAGYAEIAAGEASPSIRAEHAQQAARGFGSDHRLIMAKRLRS